jgi:signal peptidase I
VKRVIGLPGERVAIRNGTVYINGEPLDEPYVRLKRRPWNYPKNSSEPRELGPNEYFIVGDNRSLGEDYHDFGVVNESRIIGKVIW